MLAHEFLKRPVFEIPLLLVVDLVLTLLIIRYVRYTEIDWIAYMQEVGGFLSGERNYALLKGDTGPLVYPAGFVYVYTGLRYLTNDGTDILTGQYIFAVVYLVLLTVCLMLYRAGQAVPFYVWPLLLLSKRIHSIFVLRLFNDGIAVLLGFLGLYLFTKSHWKSGSVFYSLAVSVKMNMLLWAPGLLLLYIMGTGLFGTVQCLAICAFVQLAVGYPFLSTFPLEYISNSFNLGRVFMYKWTVNFKFLPEEIFLSKPLSIVLLLLTVLVYALFGKKIIGENIDALNRQAALQSTDKRSTFMNLVGIQKLTPHFIISVVFISNFIGVAFARSLHYQFYSWYFHTLPYLLWTTQLPFLVQCAVLFAIEVSFNVYPATPFSSLLLQIAHAILLVALYMRKSPMSLWWIDEADQLSLLGISNSAKKEKKKSS
jgi:alpha-1,3-mannosyltransferase